MTTMKLVNKSMLIIIVTLEHTHTSTLTIWTISKVMASAIVLKPSSGGDGPSSGLSEIVLESSSVELQVDRTSSSAQVESSTINECIKCPCFILLE